MFKSRHGADKCWDNPANDNDKPHWMQKKKPRPTVRSIRIGSVGGSGNELRVELGEDLHALVDTGATVSLLQPSAKGKIKVLSEREFREKLYLADGKTFMTATEKIKARVEDANGIGTEMEFIVTPDIQEEAIIDHHLQHNSPVLFGAPTGICTGGFYEPVTVVRGKQSI